MSAALILDGLLGWTPAAQAQGAPPTCSSKLVKHALGQTCVRGVRRWMVTLEWTYTENVLALGVQPVGAANLEGYRKGVRIPAAPSALVLAGEISQKMLVP